MSAPGTVIDMPALLALRHVTTLTREPHGQRTVALPGPIVTRRRGRGMEVDEVRAFQHGDDIRHIDRNTTARSGRPHVRTFRDERERTLLLLADFRPSMLFGTRRAFRSVAGAELLALAGWRAMAAGGRIGLLAVGGAEPLLLRPATGERAMIALIGGLARAHGEALALAPTTEAPLDTALDMAARAIPRGGTILLASGLDTPGAGFEDAVRAAAHRVDLRVALVSDAFERTAPRGAYPFLTMEGARGVRTVAGKAGQGVDERLAGLRRLGAEAVRFEAERPPEQHVHALARLHGDA